jgi:oxygen-independent coproporphyrinogen-3 oxidase
MTALYIHIPFCKKKCSYCDFVSYAEKDHLIDEYVETLCREIKLRLATGDGQLATVYFGGGTPTLLSPKHFEKLLSNYDLRITNYEISIESNPDTADKTKLKELRQLGINRLSIGAQSFNDDHLKTLGRIHNSKDVFRIFDDALSAGFDNLDLDLIFALPGQTLAQWKKDLKIAISLNPNHLSTYNLQIEENTPFYGKVQALSEETELAMYEYTIETLTAAGYKHYEISNFARPGCACQHNINYWKNGNYIGVGAGAHSHLNGKRWANPDSIEEYIAGGATRKDSHDATAQRDTLFLGLHMLEGLPTNKFQGFEKEVSELIQNGLLLRENGHYKLTRQGLYLGNEVFAKFV